MFIMKPDILYRYRNANEREFSELRNNQIWFSKPSNFNDPFDCAIRFDQQAIVENVFENFFKKSSEKLDEAVLQLIRKDVFKKEFNISPVDDVLKLLREQSVISCFAEDFNSIQMWSYYADYHKGICVGYRRNELEKYGYLNKIIYQNDIKPILESIYEMGTSLKSDKNKIFNLMRTYLFVKEKHWEHEKEWRLVRVGYSNDKYPKSILINSPKPVVVYIGCKASKCTIDRMKIYCKETSIPIYYMSMSKNKFELKYNAIK